MPVLRNREQVAQPARYQPYSNGRLEHGRRNEIRRQRERRQRERQEEIDNVQTAKGFKEKHKANCQSQQVNSWKIVEFLLPALLFSIIKGGRTIVSEMIGHTKQAAIAAIRHRLDDHNWDYTPQYTFDELQHERFLRTSRQYLRRRISNFQQDSTFALHYLDRTKLMMNEGDLGKQLAILINPDIFHDVNEQAVLFKLDELWFNHVCKAVFADFYCCKCGFLMLDEPELLKHMLDKHRKDVKAAVRNNDDEADRLMREAVHASSKKIQIQEYFRDNHARFARASSYTITLHSWINGDQVDDI
ncbi:Oidioi.mRNA.OKI2018_I69.chr2.g8073.t1.cds [Oikopleura dioica]|uniref:Oidioi.mRNA.OKI2018_I69.chr2.g8068.t1.cds n=1 Tax=Oikopleura dioica TaxID=34765 RepID=A0ABN7T8L6_OIKDI|nr:Oidioi.mRNA.OKI2018_I69.chr2.g8068.t1.cds [Oikopleura dioica]CAG5113988.1 Oidioi.mRNA.OKI2018_I69.chr2.g8073.t1.cds [Oikopleura dioica]